LAETIQNSFSIDPRQSAFPFFHSRQRCVRLIDIQYLVLNHRSKEPDAAHHGNIFIRRGLFERLVTSQ